MVSDSLFCGRSGGVAHSTPTNQKPSTAPIFFHSSAGVQVRKEKPAGGKWAISSKRQTRGCGAGARLSDGMLRGRGGHVERWRQCNERLGYNQLGQMGQHNNQTAH
jgi:hypothetical protein